MRTSRLSGLLAIALGVVTASAAFAAGRDRGDETRSAERQDIAGIEAERPAIVRSIVERFRAEMQPANRALNLASSEALITAALGRLSAERLLEASRLGTYPELRSFLQPEWQKQSPGFIALHEGGPITPNLLGDAGADLVFTPLTPCRIIDTRDATDPALQGPIGPNSGKFFQVDMPDYTTQGGFAGSCGLPPFNVSAVAINVTSTGQNGVGNLRVIEAGGGLPLAALLSYRPGINLSNAGVLRSGMLGGDDLFIYSGTGSTYVVVDIMGYFAPPQATPFECQTVSTNVNLPANGTSLGAALCPAGYTLTGAGAFEPTNGATIIVNKLNAGALLPNTAVCRLRETTGVARVATCEARCCRVPGR